MKTPEELRKSILWHSDIFKELFSPAFMIYLIYNVSYELMGYGRANSIISASSPKRIKSLLENYLREKDSTTGELKGVPIKIRAIINTGYKTSKEGVIFNSESEELSIRTEEGFKSPLFLR